MKMPTSSPSCPTTGLREAQHHRNTCPQYILYQRGAPTTVGNRIWNHLQLLLPDHHHAIQTNNRCHKSGPIAVLYTDVGVGQPGTTTTLNLVGTSQHLVTVTPNQMHALQQVGTHHVPFLQPPDWPNKALPQAHLREAATEADLPQPSDEDIRKAYNVFWGTHKRPLPPSPRNRNQAHHRPPGQVPYVPRPMVPAVLLLNPTDAKSPFARAGRTTTYGCLNHPRHAASIHHRCSRTH